MGGATLRGKKEKDHLKKAQKKLTGEIRNTYWSGDDSLSDIQKAAIVIFIANMPAYGAIILTGHSIMGTTETGCVIPGGAYGYNSTMPYGFYKQDPAAASVQYYQWDVLFGKYQHYHG